MTVQEQELIDQIHRAFEGVRLDDGISLNMTQYYDSFESEPEIKRKAQNDERNDWTAIPHETLEQFTVTFSFTDLKGFIVPRRRLPHIKATPSAVVGAAEGAGAKGRHVTERVIRVVVVSEAAIS